MLQTFASINLIPPVSLPSVRIMSELKLGHYIEILKRRFFYFLFPFALISILGLYVAAIQKPSYLSEGKILVESQVIAPDLVRPIVDGNGQRTHSAHPAAHLDQGKSSFDREQVRVVPSTVGNSRLDARK